MVVIGLLCKNECILCKTVKRDVFLQPKKDMDEFICRPCFTREQNNESISSLNQKRLRKESETDLVGVSCTKLAKISTARDSGNSDCESDSCEIIDVCGTPNDINFSETCEEENTENEISLCLDAPERHDKEDTGIQPIEEACPNNMKNESCESKKESECLPVECDALNSSDPIEKPTKSEEIANISKPSNQEFQLKESTNNKEIKKEVVPKQRCNNQSCRILLHQKPFRFHPKTKKRICKWCYRDKKLFVEKKKKCRNPLCKVRVSKGEIRIHPKNGQKVCGACFDHFVKTGNDDVDRKKMERFKTTFCTNQLCNIKIDSRYINRHPATRGRLCTLCWLDVTAKKN